MAEQQRCTICRHIRLTELSSGYTWLEVVGQDCAFGAKTKALAMTMAEGALSKLHPEASEVELLVASEEDWHDRSD